MEKENKKQLAGLSLASFFNDMGSDMIYPIWPLFVTSILGANMLVLGIIDGIGEAVVSLSKGFSGYLSDKVHRRKVFIWTGYLMAGISRIGYSLSYLWWQLIPFKILDRAGKIRSAPRDAIIADISRKDTGANFGIVRVMDNAGAVAGVLITLVLVNLLSIKAIFMLATIPSIISVLLVLFLIKENKNAGIAEVPLRFINRRYKQFLLFSVFLSLATFSYSFLLIFTKDTGFPVQSLPVFYLIFTFIAALSSYPAGKLSDKIGRKKVLYIGIITYAAMAIGFIRTGSLLGFVILFIGYGIFRGIIDTVQSAYAAELSPEEERASGIGTFQLENGLFALPSSAFAGFLWVSFGKTAPFAASIFFAAVSFVFLYLITDKP